MKATGSTKPQRTEDVSRNWHLVNVGSEVLGRAVPKIATLLQGKHKTSYAPNIDSGDFVVVVNAAKVQVTGNKLKSKIYTNYSGYPSGMRTTTLSDLLSQKPEEVVKHAVSGMLPKNKLRDKRMGRLFIFKDENHPYGDKFK